MAFEKEMIASMNNPLAIEAWRHAQACDEVGYASFERSIPMAVKLREAFALLDSAVDLIEDADRRAFKFGSLLFAFGACQAIYFWMLVLAGMR